MIDPPSLEGLEHLYSALAPAARDKLLQERLAATPHGGEAMLAVLEAWPLDRAVRTTLDEL